MKPACLFLNLLLFFNLSAGVELLRAATIDEYVGVWQGEGTYVSSDETSHFNVMITLSREGNLLFGELTPSGNASVSFQGSLINGVFTFPYPSDTPNHPDCRDWDVTGKASLDAAGTTMTLVLAGIFCGEGGGEQGTFTGILRKFAVQAPMMLLLDKEQP